MSNTKSQNEATKKISLRKLKEASELVVEISELDIQINSIKKKAQKIISGVESLKFSISGNQPKSSTKAGPVLDEDGSLINKSNDDKRPEHLIRLPFVGLTIPEFNPHGVWPSLKESPKSDFKLKGSITDSTALRILEVLLTEKQNKRAEIIERIRKIGINV